MLTRSLLAVAILVAGATANAQEKFDTVAWESANPATLVSVAPSSTPGQYVVKATVSDLNTSKVLARPTLITEAGKPATIEIGSQGGVVLKVVVNVAVDGRSASYVGEVRRGGKVESSQSATLSLGGA